MSDHDFSGKQFFDGRNYRYCRRCGAEQGSHEGARPCNEEPAEVMRAKLRRIVEVATENSPIEDPAEREVAAFEGFLLRRVPPGEDKPVPRAPKVPRLVLREDGAPCDNAKVEALVKLLADAITTVDVAKHGHTPTELSVALVGLACSVAEAVDDDFLPPIFLTSFLPEMGITEPEALGLVRTTYAEHRRYEEEDLERERIAVSVEEARRDEDERLKGAN
jgi:hypothetical protein